jgi:hypothetical protein
MTTSDLVPAIVAAVDTYATKVTAPGEYVPSARMCIDYMLWEVGEIESVPPQDVHLFPGDLIEGLECLIEQHTDTGREHSEEAYANTLWDIADIMDDMEENAND